MPPLPADRRVPVTILTGFLGAGKTTLLNRLIGAPEAGRIAVIVNEVGAVALDAQLVVGTEEEIVEIRDGCVCCTVRGDLAVAVKRLLDRRGAWFRPLRFDRIVIECSGVASPGPVVQTFLLDAALASATRVDGVVALVSAPDFHRHLEHPEAEEQIGFADLVVLNHLDRIDAPDGALTALRAINPGAPVLLATRAVFPLAALLDIGGHDPARWRLGGHDHDHDHGPDAHLHHHVLHTERPLDLGRVKLFLHFIAARRTWRVVRMKGILRCADLSRAVVVHGIHEWLEIGPGSMVPPVQSTLLVIGRDLDEGELRRGWAAVTGEGG